MSSSQTHFDVREPLDLRESVSPCYAPFVIARTWTARATGDNVRAYLAFFEDTLVPGLQALSGHLGAVVTTRDGVITVTTFWESMAAIARFADPLELAVVEPEARAVLDSFDDRVQHAEVAIDTFRQSR